MKDILVQSIAREATALRQTNLPLLYLSRSRRVVTSQPLMENSLSRSLRRTPSISCLFMSTTMLETSARMLESSTTRKNSRPPPELRSSRLIATVNSKNHSRIYLSPLPAVIASSTVLVSSRRLRPSVTVPPKVTTRKRRRRRNSLSVL